MQFFVLRILYTNLRTTRNTSLGNLETFVFCSSCDITLRFLYIKYRMYFSEKIRQWYRPMSGGSTAKTQSPRLCQAMVPPRQVVISLVLKVVGGGITSTPKTQAFKYLVPFLKLFGAYKYPTHTYLMQQEKEQEFLRIKVL